MADVELGNAPAEKDAAPLVSGSISLPSAEENTLDEPVSATILRDVRLVTGKLKVVLMPRNTSEETLKALRDCAIAADLIDDAIYIALWLIHAALCRGSVGAADVVLVAVDHAEHDGAVPAVRDGVHRRVRGDLGRRSHCHHQRTAPGEHHSVCVLGYCVFPLNIATLLCMVLGVVVSHIALRMLIVGIGFVWSTRGTVFSCALLELMRVKKRLTLTPRALQSMSGTAANQLEKLIADIETELGIDANTPVGKTAAAAAPAASEQKPKAKKEKKPAPAKKAAAPADADQLEITKLDIRVGKIVKVWKHDTADKLYCEEIDVGEDEPRQIASGLVYHYSLEEMQDRRILVLCNLKPRNLVGFKSHGMVMCAAVPIEGGKEKVAFVDPPADAKIGERIVFDGLTGEPYTPAQVEKKKVLVNIGEDMKTDASGVAKWKDHVFSTSAGPCTAPVVNGVIR